MYNYLDFEKPVADLEGKILELKKLSENGEAVDVADEIARLEKRSRDALREAYRSLTPWQKAQVARHPDRPHCLDYVTGLFSDFTPLAGDREFGEDTPSSAASLASAASRSPSSARRRAPTPRAASSTISAWPSPKATARRCASWNSPTASRCRW